MSTSDVETTVEVRHNPAANRFETTVDGLLGVANYHLAGNVMRIHHTEVPRSLEGRGIGSRIVRAVLQYADEHGLKVEPWCGFVRSYMRRHPETHRLLAEGFPALR